MAIKPITFSGPMVRAILEDRKGQTRRLGDTPRYDVGDLVYVREAWRVQALFDDYSPSNSHKGSPVLSQANCALRYAADGETGQMPADASWLGKYRQAMHMPRWASRLTLSVLQVKVERLQDISPEDAIREGFPYDHPERETATRDTYIGWYRDLWDSLNKDRAPWSSNPWVVAYSFTHQLGNVDG